MKLAESLVMTALALASSSSQAFNAQRDVRVAIQAAESVRKLYLEVVNRHPIGIPQGKDMRAFAPLLTKALRRKIARAAACGADWHRQNPGRELKPAYDWLELGLFSGGIERISPSAFVVEEPVAQKNSIVGVPVTLVRIETGEGPWIWRVTVSVAADGGRYLIDDVTFEGSLRDGRAPRLSWFLSEGCDGSHWRGFGHSPE